LLAFTHRPTHYK